jgi:hypothetical protein
MPQNETTACVPRIPTDAMVQAGREAGCFGVRKGEDRLFSFIPALDYAEVYNVWRAMWDEAMKENQHEQE